MSVLPVALLRLPSEGQGFWFYARP